MSHTDQVPDAGGVEHGTIELDGSVLRLTGEIDYLVVSDWRERHGAPAPVQVIEASAVDFLGSAGVALIIAVVQRSAPARVQLHRPTRPARRPLEAMGVLGLMDVVDG